MVGSQDAGGVFEVLLVQGDGLVEPASLPQSTGEVVPCGEGGGMVRFADVGAVFECLLVLLDGFVESAGVLVGVGEVVA